jgi:hypothetical protein
VGSSAFVVQRLFHASNEYSTLQTTPLTPRSRPAVLSVRNVEAEQSNLFILTSAGLFFQFFTMGLSRNLCTDSKKS